MSTKMQDFRVIRLSGLVLGCLTIGLCAVLIAATPQSIYSQSAPVYGEQLWLVRSQVHQTAPKDSGVALHARLYNNQALLWIASGPVESAARLRIAGFELELLDANTGGQVYYFVDKQEDPAAATSQSALLGQILYEDNLLLLLRLPIEDELRLVESLPRRGIPISLLNPAPLPAKDETPITVRMTNPQSTNPTVSALLPQLSEADLSSRIAQLSGAVAVNLPGGPVTLATRYTFSTRILDAERFLFDTYTNLGLAPFYVNWVRGSYSGRNVVVDLPGVEHPERVWVLGGHFDTNSEIPYSLAPGADDNATGIASTMRIVELLRDYQFADTIRFVHFSGEEQGQWGAQYYARELRLAGAQVQGYINLDMFGWDSNGDRVLELHTGTGVNSNSIATAFISANDRYAQGLSFERKTSSASRFSDHSAFWDYNYPAFLVIENFFTDAIPSDRNPWYHNTGDRLSRVNLNYATRIARTALATIAELAGIQAEMTTPTATPTVTPTNTATATASPTNMVTLTPTPTATQTPPPTGCVNLVVNGGFEMTDDTAWRYGGAYAGRIVTSPVHTGTSAAQLGLPASVKNQLAYSTAYQTVAVPTGGEQLLLTWWERTNGGSDGTDYREILLLNESFGRVATIEQARGPGDEQWRQRSFDVSSYSGRTLVVYFNVFNNGSGSQMGNYLDDVALLRCTEATATPTATPTKNASATPTPTPTDATAGTSTPTATPSATPTFTRTPTVTATSYMYRYLPIILKGNAQGSVTTPTSTPTPTSTTTLTPTLTSTPTATLTPTPTPSPTATATPTTTATAIGQSPLPTPQK